MQEATDTITEKEVAKKLNLSLQTLRNWRSARKGPAFIKLGSAVRYMEKDIGEYLIENKIATNN